MKTLQTLYLLFINICLLLFVRLPAVLIGPFVVAIALPFREESLIKYPFTQYAGYWWHVGLPKWAWLWSNDRDGLLGDKRGWWKTHTPLNNPYTSLFCMWWWAAIRNPANNQRFSPLLSCDTRKCDYVVYGDKVVEDDVGLGGMQAVIATHKETKRKYLGVYIVREYSRWPSRGFVFQFGFKIKPSSWNDTDTDSSRIKGFTLEFNPFKDLS